jgi:hypothetical protein
LVVSTFSWFFKVKVLLFFMEVSGLSGFMGKEPSEAICVVLSDVFDLVGRGTERRR